MNSTDSLSDAGLLALELRNRSRVTLTAPVALSHHDELAMHVRVARTNDLSVAEIGEVLLLSAIYCCVPAAHAAFAIPNRTPAELEEEAS